MDFNVATTISFSSAATCLSLSALAAYMARLPSTRHFVHAALAGLSAAAYCVADAFIAGRSDVGTVVWAGRLGFVAAFAHAAAWLTFLAAWGKRPLSRVERFALEACVAGAVASLVPNGAVLDGMTVRSSTLVGATYHDPVPGPLAVPVLAVLVSTEVLVVLSARRVSRETPKANVVAVALVLILLASISDSLASLHVYDLPYLVDAMLAVGLLSIGSVVVVDAADSAAKTAELERARAELAEQENLAAVGQLAAVVAHEVRNPVGIIFAALANLQRREREGQDAELLRILSEEAERLKQLVTRLLAAVRPFELQYSRHAAARIVKDAIAQVTGGAGVAPSEVALVGAPEAEVECDEVLLGQAISNLVQNALVANGRSAPVEVLASVEPTEPAMLRIVVADDGDGVPDSARPRLFTPFFTTRATGTGLGLAIVKRIASAHGGTIEYEPRGPRGASFVLRVPLTAQAAGR